MPADSGQATSLGHKLREEITPRGKRLLIIMAVTPWLFLLVYYGSPYLNSQTRHLIAVRAHIEKIQPQWDRFRAEHKGFERVEFAAYTGGDGEFEAAGSVPSKAHVEQLRSFILGTSPPRPLFFGGLFVTSKADLELLSTNNVSMSQQFEGSSREEEIAFRIKVAVLEAMGITKVPQKGQTSAFISVEQKEREEFRQFFNGNEQVEVAVEPSETFQNLNETNDVISDKRTGQPGLRVYIKIVDVGQTAAEAEVSRNLLSGGFVIEGFKLKLENGKWQVVKRWVVGIS
jgi:hypothetical protein